MTREEELLNVLQMHAERMRKVDAIIAEQSKYQHRGTDEVSVAIRDFYDNVNKIIAPTI